MNITCNMLQREREREGGGRAEIDEDRLLTRRISSEILGYRAESRRQASQVKRHMCVCVCVRACVWVRAAGLDLLTRRIQSEIQGREQEASEPGEEAHVEARPRVIEAVPVHPLAQLPERLFVGPPMSRHTSVLNIGVMDRRAGA